MVNNKTDMYIFKYLGVILFKMAALLQMSASGEVGQDRVQAPAAN